jgi:hypothetical protein
MGRKSHCLDIPRGGPEEKKILEADLETIE